MKKYISFLLLQSILIHPKLGYASFGDFSLSDEEKLGKQFSIFVKSSLPILYEPEIQNYITNIVTTITKGLHNTPYTFTAYVINHPAVNAFATPGGYIFIHTGLILAMENESQLAGVISHEIAHITNRHIAKQIERSQKITLASLLTGLAGLALGPAGIGILLGSLGAGQNSMLYFSRIDESEADKAGMQYLVQAGYNPFGLSQSFDIIRKDMLHKGIGRPPAYLSTHPDVQERVQTTYIQATSFSQEIQKRHIDNTHFDTIKMLLRARYDLTERASAIFAETQHPHTIFAQAIIARRKQEYKKSLLLFQNALSNNPTNQLIYREAGIAAFEANELEKAKNFLIQAHLIDNKDYFTLFYLARIYSEEKVYTYSLPLFKQILEQLPEDIEVHTFYGKELGRAGQEALGNIHLAYASLYANRLKRTKYFIEQARPLITHQEEKAFTLLESKYKERATFFKENNIPIQ